MYQCINIATHLRMVYQDWQQTVLHCHCRFAWKSQSIELGDTLDDRDWASFEMHLWVFDWMNSELHLEALIEWDWRCIWRPWSNWFGDAVGGNDRARLEYLEVVDGRHVGCYDSIHHFVNVQPWEYDKVTLPLSSLAVLAGGGQSVGWYTRSWIYNQGSTSNLVRMKGRWMFLGRCCTKCIVYFGVWYNRWKLFFGVCGTQWMLSYVYAVLGVFCTWCMLYWVFAVLGVCYIQWMLYSVYAAAGVCSTLCILYSVYTVLGVSSTVC